MEFLKRQNMHVVAASGRRDALSGLTLCEPRLVTLDLHPVRDDGLDLLRDIRSRSDVPVIVITGDQGGEVDRVVGLELGADDCVTKPFSLRELLARIRAVLRRQMIVHAAPRDSERGRCRFGGWQLDRRFRLLTNSDGASVVLTKREYGLLIAFLDAPQRPLSREQQHRRAGIAAATQARGRSRRANHYPDGARCRLRVRRGGRAVLRTNDPLHLFALCAANEDLREGAPQPSRSATARWPRASMTSDAANRTLALHEST